MVGLGALTSLTGGGGLTAPSNAESGGGNDAFNFGDFSAGNLSFGAKPNNTVLYVGFAVIGILLLKRGL